ncbi:beta-glucosidase [Austwickia chelonae]|uniref:Probable beta-glucosidase G n=1 Tax=Austwickia chelonae NBRC 105200 TaxID=1184607 RepID=K6UKR3_9MICO|nr:glycoside hydrolase family 3 C-terminal domain-containing protein [Austwickia chelonae]GAB76626.1 putative beta-glucosidase [Austwickia chelonae NBRC 105200]SEW28279.1 beta-glucosidase [Austwickia chelonae]
MPRPRLATALLAVVGIVPASCFTALPAQAQPSTTTQEAPAATTPCPWVGSSAAPVDRARSLLSHMTLDDKIGMIHGTARPLQAYGPVHAGQVAANPRLCIPALSPTDGPAGVGNNKTGVTQLPAPVALGATFDRMLATRYGQVIGAETRGKGANYALGPGVDLTRDPRAGRAFENFGEDPVHVGQMGAAEARGIQSQGVLAVAKHLGAYTQETGRNTSHASAIVDERTLNELYVAPFEALVEAKVASVMCSYNQVNNVHACNHGYLMNQVLKGRLGFSGFVISDWFGMHSSVASANAGLDLQMPDSCYYDKRLRQGLAEGKVSEQRLDDMVTRILTPMFAHGLFDRAPTGSPKAKVTNPGHAAVAHKVATDSMVLMKNDGVLPLKPSANGIAVIGSAAGRNVLASGGGSAHVIADKITTPLQGITRRAGKDKTPVTYYGGILPAQAAKYAAAADVAVVVVKSYSSENKDQRSTQLSLVDRNLIEATRKANPRTVVVLNTGSAVDLPFADRVPALVSAWYPGQEYGTALASVLFGDTNPSGRLPVTFAASPSHLPAAAKERFPGGRHDEGLAIGYRWYDKQRITPAFPFGHGLSYTKFTYSGLTVGAESADGSIPVSVDVTNTGSRPGAVVPQVYVGQPARIAGPPKALADFTKVTLNPGERKRVTMKLSARVLSVFDTAKHQFVNLAGERTVLVGDSAANLPLVGKAVVTRTTLTSRPTSAPFPGQSQSNENRAEAARDRRVCGAAGFMGGGIGFISYFGLPPFRQAVEKPTDAML